VSTTAPPAPPVRVDRVGGRDRRLDGLRALAAIAVILTHVGDWTDSITGPHALWVQQLNVGVDVFFVISAVLLYAPFVASHLDARAHPSLRTYVTRRVTRIYPAYWVALIVILPLSPIFGIRGRWQWFSVPLLIHTYQPAGLASDAGLRQAWTLVIEVSFYAFLPLYAWCVRRAGRRVGALRAEIVGVLTLIVAGPVCVYLSPKDSVVQLPYVFRVLPPTLGIFGSGMAIALAREAVKRRPEPPQWWLALGRSAVPWYTAAAVAYWAVCTRIGLSAAFGARITSHRQFEQHLLQTVVAACVVAPAVFVPAGRSWSLRMIGSRPLAFVGMVSYGIYLWHYAVIEWLVRRVGCDPTSLRPCPASVHWSFLTVSIAAVPLSIAVGAASWYLVERPMIRLGHHYGTRRRTPRADRLLNRS
jgi:peptidoglycan/LPS O-acetylase OafA/YrhL